MVVNHFNATMLLDSIAPNGRRLSTFEVTFPRFILAEFNTHRRLTRNAASSRAIPVATCIKWALEEPVIPIEWGKNQPGMQADELLTPEDIAEATQIWLEYRDDAVRCATKLSKLKVHKQLANRPLEPIRWVTVITSGTEWSNFFGLRCNINAQPEIQRPAYLMRDEYLDIEESSAEFIKLGHLMQAAYEDSKPKYLHAGKWHMPMLRESDFTEFGQDYATLRKLSTGRCARVSYLTHDGIRAPEKDIELHDGLATNGHWSPFEHIAQALSKLDYDTASGNFFGWHQYRKNFENEEL